MKKFQVITRSPSAKEIEIVQFETNNDTEAIMVAEDIAKSVLGIEVMIKFVDNMSGGYLNKSGYSTNARP